MIRRKYYLFLTILVLSLISLSACINTGIEMVVTFESNGGTPVESITYDGANEIVIPENPTRDGYTFGGWFWDDGAFLQPFTVNSVLDQPIQSDVDLTVYARWVPIEYLINYVLNEGTNSESNPTTFYIESSLSIIDPTREGYTFGGWYSDADFTTAFEFTNMPAEDITLYAKWTINIYTLQFVDNDDTILTTANYEYGADLSEVIAPTTNKVGYTFSGWDIELPTTMPANNVTLKAQYTVNQYTVTFETNGGSSIAEMSQDYNSVLVAPTAPTREGYTFGGWYSDAEFTTAFEFTNMPAIDTTLYAKWNPIAPTVKITSIVPTQDALVFEIEVMDIAKTGVISAIELYQGEKLVEALADLSVREFTGLLSNNEYTIKVTYTYDLKDGVGSQTLVINQVVTTLEKSTPTVVIDNIVPTQDSISFGVTVTDIDEVCALSAIELYQGEKLVEALADLSVREFTGLLSNNEYTIKVTYTYDLNDGMGAQALVINQVVTTLEKSTPTVVIDNIVPTQDSISFGVTVTDIDEVGAVSAIELYQGETLIEALTDLNVREFTGLLSNNEYTIKVTYTYDLNDGLGQKFIIEALSCETFPELLAISSFSIQNTNAIVSGDIITVKLNFINPDNVKVTSLIINETVVNISGLDGITNALILLNANIEFGTLEFSIGGFTYFGIEQIFDIDPVVVSVDVLKNIEVISVYNEYNAISVSEISYIYIDMIGIETYYIDSIAVSYGGFGGTSQFDNTEIEWVDSNTIRLIYDGYSAVRTDTYSNAFEYVNISSIKYGADSSNLKTKYMSGVYGVFLPVYSYDINLVSNANELQNMQNGYIYSIENDIDLDGFDWTPYTIRAVIVGNNFAIKNAMIIGMDTNPYLNAIGLFETISGVVRDLTITDFYIFSKSELYSYAGLLSGRSRDTIIDNIHITGNNTIIVNGNGVSVGGLLGINESSWISNIEINGNVKFTVSSTDLLRIGGIVGYNYGRHLILTEFSGILTLNINQYVGSTYIGGISGGDNGGHVYNSIFSGTMNLVNNHINTLDILYVGGITGRYLNEVKQNIVTGIFDLNSSTAVYFGGISGYNWGGGDAMKYNLFAGNASITSSAGIGANYINSSSTAPIDNYISYDAQITKNQVYVSILSTQQIASLDDLNNSTYYTDILSFNERYWGFIGLDYENGSIPFLRYVKNG